MKSTRIGDVARIDLASPETGNAMDTAMVEDLIGALASLPGSGAAACALLAMGPNFCIGGDHDEYSQLSSEAQAQLWVGITQLLALVGATDVPIVIGVQGRAVGGGCGLAVLGDFLVVADDARLSVPDVGFGLTVGPGVVQAVTARAGLSCARRLLLLGRALTGAEAAACGLADASVTTEQLEDEVLALAEQLTALPARAVRRARLSLDAAAGGIRALLEAEVRRRAERLS